MEQKVLHQCKNSIRIEISTPTSGFYGILKMIEKLSDESDDLPFTSEDIGVRAEHLKHYIERLNAMDNSIFLIAKHGDSPIGFGYLEGGKRQRTHHCANLGLGVLHEYSNIGIGQAVVEQLLSYARSSDSIAKIDLQVLKDNQKAIRLYKKSGFEVEGISRRALFIKDRFYDYIHMGQIID
ncbi:MAG: GNAT family protein [Peptostreptococcaceae bacterium]|nr:GNAT family protein [Peptostreptococcaceae bacterium]